jgi:hypothetical protein
MNESRAITGLDRLPWLADEREAPRRSRSGARPIAIALLILGIAAFSYWLGTKSWTLFPDRPSETVGPDRPIALPEPVPVAPEPEILNEPPVTAEPKPAQPVPAASSPRPVQRPAAKPRATAEAPKSTEEKKAETSPRTPWPVRKVEGSAGRLVQVGTFATRRQAKRGWNALMRVNPALQRLPAMVVPAQSRRDGKTYYRLQMGTTSQAHSVVLCQRLRMIGQSCIVLAEAVEKKAE